MIEKNKYFEKSLEKQFEAASLCSKEPKTVEDEILEERINNIETDIYFRLKQINENLELKLPIPQRLKDKFDSGEKPPKYIPPYN